MELSRTEQILKYGLGEVSTLPPNLSRIEELLVLLIESGGTGGGGGGTTNYNALNNKPSIEGNTLQGNKTLSQLGIQSALVFDSTPTTGSNNPVTSNGVATALSGKVDTESNKGLSTNDYTTAEKTKLAGIESGAEVNEILKVFVNDTEIAPNSDREVYITVLTNTVSNLVNYYKKTETYSSSEVDALIAGIVSIRMEIVSSLPDTGESNVIYLIPSGANNVYSQYIYTSATWSLIGTTEVDLSNYYTKSQVDELLAEKQDELTFDTTPTANSENPVTSGGLYTALNAKQDKLTIDVEPEEDSINPVTSGGVYEALSGLQEALTFDTEPTINSTNPVTSGGVYEALQNVSVDVATNQNAGIVKPDGETITVGNDGTISSKGTYSAGNGIIINEHEISTETVTFTGTEAQWNALTTAQKKTYTHAFITGDSVNEVNLDGSLSKIAGLGSVEYGASTVRKGAFVIPSLSNSHSVVNVTFDKPMPDADYMVDFTRQSPWNESITLDIMSKTANGFGVAVMSNGVTPPYSKTSTVAYTAFKLFTVEGLEELENTVSEMTTVTDITSQISLLASNCSLRTDRTWLKRQGNHVWGTIAVDIHTEFTVNYAELCAGLPKLYAPLGHYYMIGVFPETDSCVFYMQANNTKLLINASGKGTGFAAASVDYITNE